MEEKFCDHCQKTHAVEFTKMMVLQDGRVIFTNAQTNEVVAEVFFDDLVSALNKAADYYAEQGLLAAEEGDYGQAN